MYKRKGLTQPFLAVHRRHLPEAVMVFFFQAEDGIRDRSPSRGLGDVYKRQDAEGVKAGDRVKIRLLKGALEAEVTEVLHER